MRMTLQKLGKPTARLSVLFMATAACVSVGTVGVLADGSVDTGYFGGVAIMGYDPVSYFTDGKAVKGSEKYSYDWLGTPWHFATSEHRDMFMSEPLKFAPQFGGYCAGEVVNGSVTVNIDPKAFKIIDGKLYLVYDKAHANDFANHADQTVAKAEGNWSKIVAGLKEDNFH